MQFDNKSRMKIIIADRVMVIITVCHPLKVANLIFYAATVFSGNLSKGMGLI